MELFGKYERRHAQVLYIAHEEGDGVNVARRSTRWCQERIRAEVRRESCLIRYPLRFPSLAWDPRVRDSPSSHTRDLLYIKARLGKGM